MLYESFHANTNLHDWEALLAEWLGMSKADLIDKVSEQTYDQIKHYSYKALPNLSKSYTEMVIKLMHEHVKKTIGSVDTLLNMFDINEDGLDTKMVMGEFEIKNSQDWSNFLTTWTGHTKFGVALNDLLELVDTSESKLLDSIALSSIESCVDTLSPNDAANIDAWLTSENGALIKTPLIAADVPKELIDTIGIARLIKAVIEEQTPTAIVSIKVVDWQLSISAKIDENAEEVVIAEPNDMMAFMSEDVIYFW